MVHDPKKEILMLKKILISVFLMIILVLCSATVVTAEPESNVIDLSGFTIADLENMFPMSAEEEAAIVHESPGVPFIVVDVRYDPEEIGLFNGQRLRFVFDTF